MLIVLGLCSEGAIRGAGCSYRLFPEVRARCGTGLVLSRLGRASLNTISFQSTACRQLLSSHWALDGS